MRPWRCKDPLMHSAPTQRLLRSPKAHHHHRSIRRPLGACMARVGWDACGRWGRILAEAFLVQLARVGGGDVIVLVRRLLGAAAMHRPALVQLRPHKLFVCCVEREGEEGSRLRTNEGTCKGGGRQGRRAVSSRQQPARCAIAPAAAATLLAHPHGVADRAGHRAGCSGGPKLWCCRLQIAPALSSALLGWWTSLPGCLCWAGGCPGPRAGRPRTSVGEGVACLLLSRLQGCRTMPVKSLRYPCKLYLRLLSRGRAHTEAGRPPPPHRSPRAAHRPTPDSWPSVRSLGAKTPTPHGWLWPRTDGRLRQWAARSTLLLVRRHTASGGRLPLPGPSQIVSLHSPGALAASAGRRH